MRSKEEEEGLGTEWREDGRRSISSPRKKGLKVGVVEERGGGKDF